MAQYKAKKTGITTYSKYYNYVEYEYRGIKYEVTYPVANTSFCTSARLQHEDAQARIDRMLDTKTEAKAINADEIWAMYGWN